MSDIKGPRILYLDVETAPNKGYFWGTNKQFIGHDDIVEPGYTLCWAAKWDHEDEVIFDAAWTSSGKFTKPRRRAMLRHMHKLIDEADVIVHYNGNKFDMPTLNGEFVVEGMGPPAPFRAIDLYKEGKKNFRFPSHKLDYMLRVLGFDQKVTHFGKKMWHDVMEGCPKAQAKMEEYNRYDAVALQDLYKRIRSWISPHPNYALYNETNGPTCGYCGSTNLQKRGFYYTPTQKYQRYWCKDCGGWPRDRHTAVPKSKKKDILATTR